MKVSFSNLLRVRIIFYLFVGFTSHRRFSICFYKNIKIHLGKAQRSLRNMYLILRRIDFHKILLLFTDWKIFLKIHLSTWNLDYMIPKRISHTSVQNPTYEIQKRNISSIQEIISSFQNYQGLSFLLVTLTDLADLFPQLESSHGQLCGYHVYQLWWSSGKIPAGGAMGPEFKSRVLCLLLFQDGILGSLGSNLVFIIPVGITLFLTEYHEWLWNYINEILERVLPNSFSGIHKSKISCSVLSHPSQGRCVAKSFIIYEYMVLLSALIFKKYINNISKFHIFLKCLSVLRIVEPADKTENNGQVSINSKTVVRCTMLQYWQT